MRRTTTAALLCGSILLAAGCKPLDLERTVEVDPGSSYSFMIDAPKRQQKITIAVKSPGAPVDVYVVAEKDREEAEKGLLVLQPVKNALASSEKVEDKTFEATIPAKTAFAIIIYNRNPKKASVTIKATGTQ
jgi:hypothetical protein